MANFSDQNKGEYKTDHSDESNPVVYIKRVCLSCDNPGTRIEPSFDDNRSSKSNFRITSDVGRHIKRSQKANKILEFEPPSQSKESYDVDNKDGSGRQVEPDNRAESGSGIIREESVSAEHQSIRKDKKSSSLKGNKKKKEPTKKDYTTPIKIMRHIKLKTRELAKKMLGKLFTQKKRCSSQYNRLL